MKTKQKVAIALSLLMLLTGCGSQTTTTTDTGSAQSDTAVTATAVSSSDMFTDRDYEVGYDESACTAITLNGTSASCSSDAVSISGSTVTITDEGTYILSGTLEDGMVIINAENTDKVQLVLNGVSISSASSAAIYVQQADKVFVTMAADSENTLSNGGTFTAIDENNIDAVIFSKDDLTLNGNGTLTINSPAGHGIVSKDDLVITSGTYAITAASHGLSGKDSVRISSGTFTITAEKDGIHAENTEDTALGFVYIQDGAFDITATGDGISASGQLETNGGNYDIVTGGGSATVTTTSDGDMNWERPTDRGGMGDGTAPSGAPDNAPDSATGATPPSEPADTTASDTAVTATANTTDSTDTSTDEDTTVSAKGLKASGALVLNSGSFTIDSADDAFHSNADMTVAGGTYTVSTGDDGFHADNALLISDGTIDISKSYEGLEGMSVTIAGGDVSVVASDDGINAANGSDQSGMGGFSGFSGNGADSSSSDSDDMYIEISGGKLFVNAGGDGLDSNGSLRVSGGETFISGPTDSGNGALDYTTDATITSGVFVAVGSSGMAQNFDDSSTQGAILVSMDSQEADSTITLTDSSGSELGSWTSEKTYDCVVISCPEITDGESYTLTAGTSSTAVTMSGLIYGSGGTMGGGDMRGGMKGNRPTS